MARDERREHGRVLARELGGLRALVEECARQYELDMKARVDEMLHVLETETEGDGSSLPKTAALEKLADKVKRVRGRPHRGRAKDLRRIQDLVDELMEAVLGGGE